ncbi:hypothetical protein QEZ54_09815 [Catellatospora sp. KI3]|uniref:hypothetical protein n=1 Tax=Catellatospora sp. KI3 TaxID=3041620 RepID=UPI0024826679|nr:hypothetical protein [Catellatospora sp. KI3]MDI1461263.1 hypothetical protein [Catellatospora sp. KI3]
MTDERGNRPHGPSGADGSERQPSADELRRRQQLGQTPGMFVDPPTGEAQEPDIDAAGSPTRSDE